MHIIPNSTHPAPPAIAPAQSSICAASSDAQLMAQTDARRIAYYADFRKSIIAAWGEVTA